MSMENLDPLGQKPDTEILESELRKFENVMKIRHENPTYSTCKSCGLPWSHCKHKTIKHSENGGMFAMCTYCWDKSDVDERLHHYRTLWLEHKNRWNHVTDWEMIERNIRSESLLNQKP